MWIQSLSSGSHYDSKERDVYALRAYAGTM